METKTLQVYEEKISKPNISCQHTTAASLSSQPSLQTEPHNPPTQTSTLPRSTVSLSGVSSSASRTSVSLHSEATG